MIGGELMDKKITLELPESSVKRIKYALALLMDLGYDKDLNEKLYDRIDRQYEKQR